MCAAGVVADRARKGGDRRPLPRARRGRSTGRHARRVDRERRARADRVPLDAHRPVPEPCREATRRATCSADLARQEDRDDTVALKMVPDRKTMTVSYEVVEAATEPSSVSTQRLSPSADRPPVRSVALPLTLDYVEAGGESVADGAELMAVGLLPPRDAGRRTFGERARATRSPDASSPGSRAADLGCARPRAARRSRSEADGLSTSGPAVWHDHFRRSLHQTAAGDAAHALQARRARRTARCSTRGSSPSVRRRSRPISGCSIDRVADASSTLCTWDSRHEKTDEHLRAADAADDLGFLGGESVWRIIW